MVNPLQMETPRRLYGDCADIAVRINLQWSRSQSRQSVKEALVLLVFCNLPNGFNHYWFIHLSERKGGASRKTALN